MPNIYKQNSYFININFVFFKIFNIFLYNLITFINVFFFFNHIQNIVTFYFKFSFKIIIDFCLQNSAYILQNDTILLLNKNYLKKHKVGGFQV